MSDNTTLLETAALAAILWPLMGLAAIPGWFFGRNDRVKSLRFILSFLFGLWVVFFGLRFTAWVGGVALPTPMPAWVETTIFFTAGLGLAAALLIVFSLPVKAPKPAYLKVQNLADIYDLSNESFNHLVKFTYAHIGYNIEPPANPSQAKLINFIATGTNCPTRLIHSRRYAGRVGEPVLRDLIRMIEPYPNAQIDVITSSTFSPQAEEYAHGKPFNLIDGDDLLVLYRRALQSKHFDN
jgi:hypothetical protein